MKKLLTVLAVILAPLFVKGQLTVTITTTNINCNSACNGSATATVTGGFPPYTYLWTPQNMTTVTATNLCAGSYTVTVTDGMANTATATCVITQPPALSVTASALAASACNVCDGQLNAIATGGAGAYTYCWNSCAVCTGQTCPNICAGAYTVEVTDANGCTASAVAVVTAPGGPSVTITNNAGPMICEGTYAQYNPSVNGGTAPYAYNWTMTGGAPSTSTAQNPASLYSVAGSYTTNCTVTDANGCTGTGSMTLTVAPNPVIVVTEIPATCNQSNASMSASGAIAYTWVPGNLVGPTINSLMPGFTYTCTGTDANGCATAVATLCTDSCDYVWPGDANDDAVADNIDILDIGIANGATGTARANASTAWIGQPSTAWGQTLLSGTDYKWVDCDGNGAIDPLDTNAVVLNYGMVHSNRLIAPSTNAVAPTLSISFNQDSLTAGQPGSITLSLGDTVDQATNIYGLAFRLNYDAQQLSTPTFGMNGGATWFGTPGSDMMRVVLHPNAAMGYVDVAITRLDHQDVSGFGTIGQIYFTATTNLVGSGNTSDVSATITNVTLVNSTGTSQVVNVANDNIVIGDTGIIMAVTPVPVAVLAVYPNPASEMLTIHIPAGPQQLVIIEDLSGRVVYSQMHAAGTNAVSVSGFTPGMYIVRVTDGTGNYSTEKITIAE